MVTPCPKCGCQLEVKLVFASGPKSSEASTGEIGELLQTAETQSLNAWEQEFVSKLRERYDLYGERVLLSDKQRDVLNKIVNK